MTDTTTTTSSSETIDTSLQDLEAYFGVDNIDLEDFLGMSNEERIAYLESLLEQKLANEGKDIDELNIDDLNEFEDALDELHSVIYTSKAQLQFMIDQGGTHDDINKWNKILDDLDKLDELTTGDNNLFDNLETAFDEVAGKHITVENGDTENLDLSNATDGDVIEVTAAEVAETSESIHDNDENANWLDLDKDGYNEYEWDADGDGIPDDPEYLMEKIRDFDNDGFLTQADVDKFQGKSDTTLSFPADDIESAYIRPGAGDTVEWVLTLKDGGKVVVKATGFDLFLLPVELTNAESVPDYTLAKIKEKSNSANSLHNFTYGYEYSDPNNASWAYAFMKDQTDNTIDVTPKTTDFVNKTNYIIQGDPNTSDKININLDDFSDAEITFSTDGDGNVVMTVTATEGTITITFVDLEFDGGHGGALAPTEDWVGDTISITGGTFSTDAYNDINNIIVPYADDAYQPGVALGDWQYKDLFSMIIHDEELLRDEAVDDGFIP